MAQRERLSWEENLVAAIAGLGILLLMIAGMLIGFTDSNKDTAETLAIAGAILVVVGAAVWLLLLQPWHKFDDLKTPHYTGHHHDDDHDDGHAHEEEHHELVAGEVDIVTADVVPEVTDIQVIEENPTDEPQVLAVTAEPEVSDSSIDSITEEAEAPIQTDAANVSEDVEANVESALDTPDVTDVQPSEEKPIDEPQVSENTVDPVVEETEAPPQTDVVDPSEDVEANIEPDDLRILEGIGVKVEAALNAEGITTFAQLSEMSPDELEQLVKVKQKVRIVGSTKTWVRQAKLAASGDIVALEALQQRIKNGYLYDDLTQISGLGDKAQEALNKAKIRSYEDLSSASVNQLNKILDKAGLNMNPEGWPEAAKSLVE